jgi:hypothetical protein
MSTRRNLGRSLSLGAALLVAWSLTAAVVRAQQINGVAGSSNATISIKGTNFRRHR